ncbi:MAG TPA: acyltransferase [Acidobacteriaceae bacterium]|nr:acyltransferase [Acidobacteriaceae bacterium]
MSVTSLVPFVLLMTLFVVAGYFLCRKVSPYNSLVPELLRKKGYYQELESMRGILALSVVVHHAVVYYFLLYYQTPEISGRNATFYSQLGTAPVTFFFFITAFLFWSKLIADPKPQPAKFMVARLRRLGPAYLGAALLMFSLVAVFSHFRLHESPVRVGVDITRALLGETPQLNGLSYAPWLWGVTWTLQFEFLFYLLVPFLGWFAGSLRKSLLFIAGCNALYAGTLVIDPAHWHLHGFFMFRALVRFLSFTFCIGFITAHLMRNERIRNFGRSKWAAPISIALVLVALFFLPAQQGPLESIVLAIPFLAVAGGCDFWGVLRKRPLLFLGQISYSVYLIHCLLYGAILIPLYNVLGTEMRSPALFWAIVVVMAPFIVGMATLWNHTFELPFMGRRTSAPRMVPISSNVPLQSKPV